MLGAGKLQYLTELCENFYCEDWFLRQCLSEKVWIVLKDGANVGILFVMANILTKKLLRNRILRTFYMLLLISSMYVSNSSLPVF